MVGESGTLHQRCVDRQPEQRHVELASALTSLVRVRIGLALVGVLYQARSMERMRGSMRDTRDARRGYA